MQKLNATLLLGIVVAILGFGLVLTYGRTVEKRIADGRETTQVLVASTDLPAGTPASALKEGTSFKLTSVPRAYVPEGGLTNLDNLQDQVLLGPVPLGTQLSKGLFGTAVSAAAVRPSANNVAVAVEVGLSPGVARYLSVGSIVDVFVTYGGGGTAPAGADPKAQGMSSNRTKLFLSGVKVLAVSVAEPPKDPKSSDASATVQQTSNVIALLDVSPLDAERLVNAANLGELYLGLSSKDARHTTPTGVTPDDVVSANR